MIVCYRFRRKGLDSFGLLTADSLRTSHGRSGTARQSWESLSILGHAGSFSSNSFATFRCTAAPRRFV